MTARTEIPCMSDCDIKVNIHAICKHIFAEQELHHRGAATAQIMFDIQEIKRTGGIFGSLYKMATSAEGKENHFMPIGKCPWFLDQKLPHKSNPKNVLCGVGFFNSKPNRAQVLTLCLCLLCCGIEWQGQVSKVSDIYKFMGWERLHPNILREPPIVYIRTSSITFERLQSQKDSKWQQYF